MKRAELAFHVALAAIVPVVSLPIVWTLAIMHRGERPWSRRLVFLAIVDTIAAASLIALFASGIDVEAPPRRLGVVLEEAEGGARVGVVHEGSPAARAGVREGDVIVRAGGRRVRSIEALQREVARAAELELTIERNGEELTVTARPGAFTPDPGTQRCSEATALSPWDLAPYAVFAAIAAALWILGRRRARQWTTWLPLVAILAGGAILGAFVSSIACAYGGALRSSAIGLFATEISMAIAGGAWLLFTRARAPELADDHPPWSFWRTYPSALLYAAAWMMRVWFIAGPLLVLSRELGAGGVSPELEGLLGARDPITFALVTASAVVLAPLAEETLFRGILLPHLGRTMQPFTAIYLGAILFGVLHVAHGVMFVGPLTLGVVLGWARLRSRGLLTPIALHVTFNGTATLLSALG